MNINTSNTMKRKILENVDIVGFMRNVCGLYISPQIDMGENNNQMHFAMDPFIHDMNEQDFDFLGQDKELDIKYAYLTLYGKSNLFESQECNGNILDFMDKLSYEWMHGYNLSIKNNIELYTQQYDPNFRIDESHKMPLNDIYYCLALYINSVNDKEKQIDINLLQNALNTPNEEEEFLLNRYREINKLTMEYYENNLRIPLYGQYFPEDSNYYKKLPKDKKDDLRKCIEIYSRKQNKGYEYFSNTRKMSDNLINCFHLGYALPNYLKNKNKDIARCSDYLYTYMEKCWNDREKRGWSKDYFEKCFSELGEKLHLGKPCLKKNKNNNKETYFAYEEDLGLFEYLNKKGMFLDRDGVFDESIVLNCGLFKRSEKDKNVPYYTFFFNRVMFPIFDTQDNVIGFGGRVLDDNNSPKYLNSGLTPLFNKNQHLYGEHIAIKALNPELIKNNATINPSDSLIVCEGYMDVIAMQSVGLHQAVASLGTSLTLQHIEWFKAEKNLNKIYLLYDSDGAGKDATIRAIELFRQAKLDIPSFVINLKATGKEAKDPDEFIKKYGKGAFEELLPLAKDSFSWYQENKPKRLAEKNKNKEFVLSKDNFKQIYDIKDIFRKLSTHSMSINDMDFEIAKEISSKYDIEIKDVVKTIQEMREKELRLSYERIFGKIKKLTDENRSGGGMVQAGKINTTNLSKDK